MDLRQFINSANKDERAYLCEFTSTSLNMLRQIGYEHRGCGPVRACLIEIATRTLAAKAPMRLSVVSRHSLNTELETIQDLLQQLDRLAA